MADGERVLRGKVIDTRGGAVGNADVWLFRQGGSSTRTTSEKNGTFEVDVSDAATWPEGEYRLRVLPPDVALDKECPVKIPKDGSPAPVVMDVSTRHDVSFWWGLGFLVVLCAMLVAASWFYLDMHGVTLEKLRNREAIGQERIGALSEPLADALRLTREQASGVENWDGPETTPTGQPQRAGVTSSLATAEEIFGQVKRAQVGVLDESKALLMEELFKEAKAALAAGDGARLEAALAALVEQVEDSRSSFLWEENPGRLLEVLFWALLATLLRLIFNAGHYLFKGTFLRTAIPHHLAFLFILPVVAVIIALVLMVVRVDPGIDGTGALLDMSSVLVSIILAALIGLAPWKAWGFLRKLADRVFERLAGLLRNGDDGDGAGNGDGQGAAA